MEQIDSDMLEFKSSGVGETFMFRVLHKNKRIVSIPGELLRSKPKAWTVAKGIKPELLIDLSNRVQYAPKQAGE